MRVLVTGAFGFLGRHLTAALIDRGDEVVALQRDGVPVPGPHTTVVHGDARDQQVLERAISQYEVGAVVHLAAQTQVSTARIDPTSTVASNVLGAQAVLEASRRQRVPRVVVASSDKAYGDGPVPYVEDQPLRPHGIYATSKAMADMLAQSYIREYGMSVAITRCANLYGPGHMNWSTLIPGTIRSALRGEARTLRSDGRMERDFLYVEDAVRAYLRLLDVSESGPFNFGSGVPRAVQSVAEMVVAAVGSSIPIVVQGSVDDAGEIRRQFVDCKNAHTRLDWYPQASFEEGLAETVLWYKYNGGPA